MKKIVTHSPDETQQVAVELVNTLPENAVIALQGDLGSGKTTFTQGLARALGVEGKVNSPTFLIHKTYRTKNKIHPLLHHLDLYRTQEARDIQALGIENLLLDPGGMVVIEWPAQIVGILPAKRTNIHLVHKSDTEREISIENKV